MALTYFTVTGTLKAATTDTSGDIDGNPDIENITSFVIFTPNVPQVYDTAASTIYRIQPIKARTNLDLGQILNIDGTAVTLIANTSNLEQLDGTPLDELTYRVTFENVNYDEGATTITPFTFTAPSTATTINLATVTRLP